MKQLPQLKTKHILQAGVYLKNRVVSYTYSTVSPQSFSDERLEGGGEEIRTSVFPPIPTGLMDNLGDLCAMHNALGLLQKGHIETGRHVPTTSVSLWCTFVPPLLALEHLRDVAM